MPVAEPSLRFRPDEQHPAVGIEVALLHQVRRDLRRVGGERGERQPFLPGPLSLPAFLQAQGEKFMRAIQYRRYRWADFDFCDP